MTDANGWIRVRDHKPTMEDGDAQHCVIVWHMYNGIMVYGIQNISHNQMITHWRRNPPPPEDYIKNKRGGS